MTFLKNKWIIIALALLCWAVITSFTTGYYYYQYTDISEKLRRLPVHLSMSVDYGNGTIMTFDEVYLFQNATVLDALRAVAENLDMEYWPGWGTIVRSINGVANEGIVGWQYLVNGNWGTVAADLQVLVSGDQIEWKYAEFGG